MPTNLSIAPHPISSIRFFTVCKSSFFHMCIAYQTRRQFRNTKIKVLSWFKMRAKKKKKKNWQLFCIGLHHPTMLYVMEIFLDYVHVLFCHRIRSLVVVTWISNISCEEWTKFSAHSCYAISVIFHCFCTCFGCFVAENLFFSATRFLVGWVRSKKEDVVSVNQLLLAVSGTTTNNI